MERDYLQFLFSKCFRSTFYYELYQPFIEVALSAVQRDSRYHYPGRTEDEVADSIRHNTGWLPIFLYRLGNSVYNHDNKNPLLTDIHDLMRQLCGMEIYFSISIGDGFEIRHGLGSVIGSRCSIGKGFVIHQGCTIGHKAKYGDGPIIGDNVEMGVNSSILGKISVGDNVVIGAHALVLRDVADQAVIKGVY